MANPIKKKPLHQRVFIADDEGGFVAFYSDGTTSIGYTKQQNMVAILSYDDLDPPGLYHGTRVEDSFRLKRTFLKVFTLLEGSAKTLWINHDGFQQNVMERIRYKQEDPTRKDISLSEAQREKRSTFIDIVSQIPEANLLPNYIYILDSADDIKQVCPGKKHDRIYKTVGMCDSKYNIMYVSIGRPEYNVRRTTFHEQIHGYDAEKGQLSLQFSNSKAKEDEKNIDKWKILVDKLRANSPGRLNSEEETMLDDWIMVVGQNLTPRAITSRLPYSSRPPHIDLMIEMVDRLHHGFKLETPAYEYAWSQFRAGNRWLIRSENLAYFTDMVRSFSNSNDYLNPDAPMLEVIKLLAPELTEFYREVYLQQNLIPDMKAFRENNRTKPVAAETDLPHPARKVQRPGYVPLRKQLGFGPKKPVDPTDPPGSTHR